MLMLSSLTSLSLVDAAAEREALRLVDGLGCLVVLLGLFFGDPEKLAVALVGGCGEKDRPSLESQRSSQENTALVGGLWGKGQTQFDRSRRLLGMEQCDSPTRYTGFPSVQLAM
jgi:hypothetical protein